MAFGDKVPPPFRGLAPLEEAYWNAAYLPAAMGLEFDAQTGAITTRFERGEDPITGSPGEIIADKRFYIPNVASEADRINLGFVLGYCLAQLEAKRG